MTMTMKIVTAKKVHRHYLICVLISRIKYLLGIVQNNVSTPSLFGTLYCFWAALLPYYPPWIRYQ